MATKTGKHAAAWWQALDQREVDKALEEATVDAYDQYEQHTALVNAIEEQLEFPFHARVLGEDVEVVDVETPRGDPFAVDLVCQRQRKRYCIEVRSVELFDPLPEGCLYLAAYLMWKKNL